MVTTSPDISDRLVVLFCAAGLLNEADHARFLAGHKKQKSLIEILNSSVSKETFKEFLTYDVAGGLKGGGKTGASALGSQLSRRVLLDTEEISELLSCHEPDAARIGDALVDAGGASRSSIDRTLAEARKLKHPPANWLLHEGQLTNDALQRVIASDSTSLRQQAALFLSLCLLAHNQSLASGAIDSALSDIEGKSNEEITATLSDAAGIDSRGILEKIENGFRLPEADLSSIELDASLFELFPPGLLRRQTFVPLFREGNLLALGVSDPLSLTLPIMLNLLTGLWIQPYFVPSDVLIDRLNTMLPPVQASPIVETPPAPPVAAHAPDKSLEDTAPARPKAGKPGKAASKKSSKPAKAASPPDAGRDEKSRKAKAKMKQAIATPPSSPASPALKEVPADSGSAVHLVSSLIENAIEMRATDIHLESGREGMVVRYRIDGRLTRILNVPANLRGPVTSRIKVLANMDVTERRRAQDGHIMLEIGQRHFDFRIATVPTVFGEKVAIRILDSSRVMTGLGESGMNKKQLAMVERMIARPHGIILVTGPTGSGKTSTLYACLNVLNEEHRHLVTIEDPVEYQLEGINQIQVDAATGMTFSDGLRAILRQDPNIIMVGEIRDPDTARTAVRAALTGHLVFSTLHTNTALGAIQSMENLGASRYMIGAAMTGVISQRLVRRLCKCAKKKPVTKAMASQLGMKYTAKLRFNRPVGCEDCLGTGYSGRVGIFEVLEISDKLRKAILANEPMAALEKIVRAAKMDFIQDAGIEKIKEGVTSPEEVIENVVLEV